MKTENTAGKTQIKFKLKIQAVLFDLDNTLILFDEKEFYKNYVYSLSSYFNDIINPQEFEAKLMVATRKMSGNDGRMNNAEYFISEFGNGLNINNKELWQRFEKFYNNEFIHLKNLMNTLQDLFELILRIKNLGIKIVIASNPMLPENVQKLRLEWAGLNDISFDLITHATNSKFCKPNPKYYSEICHKINILPKNCLMVGNDEYNDMIASKIGMTTFLVKNKKTNDVEVSRKLADFNGLEIPKPDYSGDIHELDILINKLNFRSRT